MQSRPRRSALYMPATNARALEKAKTLAADAIIIDLEDSIAPERKAEARTQAIAAVKGGGYGRRELVIRLNGPSTSWFDADVAAAVAAAPDAILIPKIESAAEMQAIGERLKRHGARPELSVWIMMETPLAVLNAREIAAARRQCPECRLSCLVLGTNDIQKETRALDHPERLPLMFALQTCVTAARAYGLDILDGVFNDFRDESGFRRECSQGRLLGMDGKTLIHPSQVPVANEIFAPPADEVAWARRVIAAFEEPESKGKGAVSIDGRMIELLHAEIARRTVALADAIADLENRR
ncbi:MAG: CoA ester lyase [Hyphomicrobiaceae bacterium]